MRAGAHRPAQSQKNRPRRTGHLLFRVVIIAIIASGGMTPLAGASAKTWAQAWIAPESGPLSDTCPTGLVASMLDMFMTSYTHGDEDVVRYTLGQQHTPWSDTDTPSTASTIDADPPFAASMIDVTGTLRETATVDEFIELMETQHAAGDELTLLQAEVRTNPAHESGTSTVHVTFDAFRDTLSIAPPGQVVGGTAIVECPGDTAFYSGLNGRVISFELGDNELLPNIDPPTYATYPGTPPSTMCTPEALTGQDLATARAAIASSATRMPTDAAESLPLAATTGLAPVSTQNRHLDAVAYTFRIFAACANSADLPRATALFTPAYWTRVAPASDAPDAGPSIPNLLLRMVNDPRGPIVDVSATPSAEIKPYLLANTGQAQDGRIITTVSFTDGATGEFTSQTVVLVQRDEMWLIDAIR